MRRIKCVLVTEEALFDVFIKYYIAEASRVIKELPKGVEFLNIRYMRNLGVFSYFVESGKSIGLRRGLPEGSEFLGVSYVDDLVAFKLYYTHPSFDEIKDFQPIPEF